METVNYISVYEELGSLLNTREAATELIRSANKLKSSEVELDFSKVEFMSRSFADQFHKDKISFQEKTSKIINISNANEEIIRMLQTVSNTQDKKDREFEKIPVYKFSDEKLLYRYLFSI